MNHLLKLTLLFFWFPLLNTIHAQTNSEKKPLINRIDGTADTLAITRQDAIYQRPFIGLGGSKTAVGGYIEGNTNYFAEDGVSEGFSMELRRFNIFLYSSISKRIKFLSELEFEHGTEEIALETALIDFNLHQAINFRAGILLPQIGIFNANHDSPVWEFVDRPLSSTLIIPSTLSEVGFGLHGKFYSGNNTFTYSAYLTNGLGANIILNEEGKTFIPAGKSPEMFEEDNNGTPMFNGRIAARNRKIGELGFSYYGGVYNNFRIEGEEVEEKRNLGLFAIDFSTQIQKLDIKGEYVYATIQVPEDLGELYGTKQQGFFTDFTYTVKSCKILDYDNAQLLVSARIEYVDFNLSDFSNIDAPIRDEIVAFSPGIGFRPTGATSFRANYRFQRNLDFLGNPAAKLGGFQVGFATYF